MNGQLISHELGKMWLSVRQGSLIEGGSNSKIYLSASIWSEKGWFQQNPNTSKPVTPEIWHHVTVTITPGGFVTYLDGKWYHGDSEPYTGSPSAEGKLMKVCAMYNKKGRLDCDELAVWNREFDASEVQELYQSYQ